MASSRRTYVPALRFDRLTAVYDPIVGLTTRERAFKARMLDQAALAPGDRVLDVGCGTGTLAVWAKRRQPRAEITGLDADPAILERAARKVADAGVDVRLDQGLAEELPYPDASFDKVLSSLTFHHLSPEAKEAGAREIARVLVPGGELHLADWGAARNRLDRALFLGVQLFDGFDRTRDNVAGRLPAILERAGLADVAERSRLRVLLGTLALYFARRPA